MNQEADTDFFLIIRAHTRVGVFIGPAHVIPATKEEAEKFRDNVQAKIHALNNLTIFAFPDSDNQREITFPSQVILESVFTFSIVQKHNMQAERHALING